MTSAALIARAKETVLLVTVLGIPLVFFGAIDEEPFNITKLSLLLTGVTLSLALHLAHLALGHRTRGLRKIAIPALVLTLPLTLSWIASPYRGWALFGQFSRFTGLLPYAAFSLLGVLLVDAFWERREVLIRGIASIGALVGAYAFIQALGLDPLWRPGEEGGGLSFPPSSVGHNNFAGGFLGIAFPFALYLWISDRSRSWIGMSATISIALGLMMTNSQGGWLAAIAGLSVVLGAAWGRRWSPAAPLGRLAAVAAMVAVLAGVIISTTASEPPLGPTAKARGLMWGAALEMGAESPFVGRGPSAFAVEGSRYRSLALWLVEPQGVDDPHSVPLAFWANTGIGGALGITLLFGWIFYRGAKAAPREDLTLAFFAGAVAYIAQSLVSIDELTLRAAFCIAVAGLAIGGGDKDDERPSEPRLGERSRVRVVGAAIVALCVACGGAWYSFRLMSAHRSIIQGRELFAADAPLEGQARFERAIHFRYEPRYLAMYARELGLTALREGEDGAPFLVEMEQVNAYLDDFPEGSGFLTAAQLYLYWGHFEPGASARAEAMLDRARRVMPHNPEVDVRLAQVHLARGEAQVARDVLEGWSERLEGRVAGFWGTLAVARWADGDHDTAIAALEQGIALNGNECRVLIARAAISIPGSVDIRERAKSVLSFNCPSGDVAYLEDLLESFGP